MNEYKKVYDQLTPKLKGTLLLNEPLAKHTTFRVGGPAALYFQADNVSDLALLLKYCDEKEIDCLVIGRGSNLLFSDKGFDGVVVRLGRDFNKLKIDEENNQIIAGAAVVLARVISKAHDNSLRGLGFCVGIPATVGGAIASNAGAFGSNICELVSKLHVVDKNGLGLMQGPFNTGYRKGPLKKNEIVIEAIFNLVHGNKTQIKAEAERYYKKRKSTQPLNLPNAGSVFKNPSEKVSAGRLIEECGLKGERVGDAMISKIHANFIVNKGRAKASDVYSLIRLAKATVKEKHNIELEPEVKILGDFDEQESG